MIMQKALHLRDDIDRLYGSRRGVRGLASLEHSIKALIQRLEENKNRRGRLIAATRNNTDFTSINRTKEEKKKTKLKKQNIRWTFQAKNKYITKENLDEAQKNKP